MPPVLNPTATPFAPVKAKTKGRETPGEGQKILASPGGASDAALNCTKPPEARDQPVASQPAPGKAGGGKAGRGKGGKGGKNQKKFGKTKNKARKT